MDRPSPIPLCFVEKKGKLPDLLMMILPNDHTSGTRPGLPRPESAVADNDVSLGRIIEAVRAQACRPAGKLALVVLHPRGSSLMQSVITLHCSAVDDV